jgi:hypothetical protein
MCGPKSAVDKYNKKLKTQAKRNLCTFGLVACCVLCSERSFCWCAAFLTWLSWRNAARSSRACRSCVSICALVPVQQVD